MARTIVRLSRRFKVGDRIRLENMDNMTFPNIVHAVSCDNIDSTTKVSTVCGNTRFVTYVMGSKKPVNCMYCLAGEIAPGEG